MSETGDPVLIGRRVAGKFVVETFLGGGAMGAVYRATDATLERKVALKVMHPAVAVDPSFVSRFHREARAASRLDHPNSMRVIEFGEEPDGLLYIAMEYLEGRDLYKVIHEDWPLSDARISDIMMKALAAITMAHEMGVIHRDLKPENIMILNRKDDEGFDIVKVCDFGIAKITEKDDEAPGGAPKTAGQKLTTAGLVVGTPEYMSPEQARGEKLDQRSDLYSMGIILYQLLTGRTPFLAETALAVVLKHISEPPQPPHVIYAGVHKGLEAVCLRALSKSREDRFQSARDMRLAIKAVIEGRPMPVDMNASTAVDPTSNRSLPASGSSSAPPPRTAAMHPLGTPPPAPAASSAGASKVTPLGTSLVPPEERRSRFPLVATVALLALVAGGAVAFVKRDVWMKSMASTSTAAPTASTPTSTSAVLEPKPAPTTSTTATASAATDPPPAPTTTSTPEANPRGPKHTTLPPLRTSDPRSSTPAPPPPAVEPPPAPPPPTPTPNPEPAPPPVTPAPPPVTPAPAPPPFSAASCRAVVGGHRSVSGYNANNLTLRGTDAAWTSCAKSSIKDKPPGPIAASVRVHFNDNKAFKSATCAGCPHALAACVASSTGRTVSVSFKGDATGDPEFEIPVTFSCD